MLESLDNLPIWQISALVMVLILLANELGYRLARVPGARSSEARESGVVQNAAYTLVGLLMAFSFSVALGRFDSRRQAFVQEANAIGTTYLRAGLLDARSAEAMREDLRDYVALRLAYAQAEADPQRQASIDRESERMQRSMWALAMQAARRDPRSTTIPLVLTTLNETIDLSTVESAVLAARIPASVIAGLVIITMISAALMGFGFGAHGNRALPSSILYALMLALALANVLDLDRAQRGTIRVNLDSMIRLQQSLEQ